MTKEDIGSQKEMMDMLKKMSQSIIQIENKLNKLTAKNKVDEQETPLVKNNTKLIANAVGVGVPDDPQIKNTEKPKLIISERTGNVYLPYTKEEIEYYKTCGYETEVEIIKRFFTIPLKQYENFAKSRVRERI